MARWIGVTVATIFIAGCGGCQRQVTCEPGTYYLLKVAGQEAQPDLSQPGRAIPSSAIEFRPRALVFTDPTHLTAFWLGYGHVSSTTELIFSPSEAKARSIKDTSKTYPLVRYVESGTETVRFGFHSALCVELSVLEHGGYCREYHRSEELLAVEMTCSR